MKGGRRRKGRRRTRRSREGEEHVFVSEAYKKERHTRQNVCVLYIIAKKRKEVGSGCGCFSKAPRHRVSCLFCQFSRDEKTRRRRGEPKRKEKEREVVARKT